MSRVSAASDAPSACSSPWTKDARITFLVGCPRSGTTWLQNMVAMHPAVATGPETHFFSKATRFEGAQLEKSPPRPAGILQYMTAEEFYTLFAEFFHGIISRVSKPDVSSPVFLEKSPQHALFLPLIARCLPSCRVIHLIRDGRHVVASLLRASRTWGQGLFPSDPSTAAQLWKQSVCSARETPRLLQDATSYYEIRYEDLRTSPQSNLRGLFQWLDLEISEVEIERIVAANSLAETTSKHSFDAITVPSRQSGVASEPRGFFGAASVGDSFELTALQEYACYEVFGDLLQQTGYCDRVPKIPLWAKAANSWRVKRLLEILHLGT